MNSFFLMTSILFMFLEKVNLVFCESCPHDDAFKVFCESILLIYGSKTDL